MTYPKKFMTVKEMQEFTGLKRDYLLGLFRRSDNNFAMKLDPTKANSTIIFDTEKYDEWMQKEIKQQVKVARRDISRSQRGTALRVI